MIADRPRVIVSVEILQTFGPVSAAFLASDGQAGAFVDLPCVIYLVNGAVIETPIVVEVDAAGQVVGVPSAQFKTRIAAEIAAKLGGFYA